MQHTQTLIHTHTNGQGTTRIASYTRAHGCVRGATSFPRLHQNRWWKLFKRSFIRWAKFRCRYVCDDGAYACIFVRVCLFVHVISCCLFRPPFSPRYIFVLEEYAIEINIYFWFIDDILPSSIYIMIYCFELFKVSILVCARFTLLQLYSFHHDNRQVIYLFIRIRNFEEEMRRQQKKMKKKISTKQVHWLIVHKFVLYILCIYDVKLVKKFVTIEKSPLIFLILCISSQPNRMKPKSTALCLVGPSSSSSSSPASR